MRAQDNQAGSLAVGHPANPPGSHQATRSVVNQSTQPVHKSRTLCASQPANQPAMRQTTWPP
eukprot:3767603-Prorocentrum_lima.AAC.1